MMLHSPDRYPSPLRYPGGKGKVANFLKLVFLENDLLGSEYVELYAGGASVALSLLYEDFASHVHINDINRSIYAFWKVALDDPEGLCRAITDTPVTVEEWKRQKAIQSATDPTELELAFSTFYLNRTNRSGIIAGGIIGGHEQQGGWKIDARYNKAELCRRIRKVARFRSRISLTGADAAAMLGDIATRPARSTFVYLDPPYYVKGKGLYDNFYKHQDHVDIAQAVQALRCPWVVSYDAVPEILSLYGSIRSLRYSLNYSAAEKHRGSEAMFFSQDLEIPSTGTAAGITVKQVNLARQATLI
ncbi:DNA adenine methylase [Micromonospora endophytica]|nr:DNA adenine methylase [Micromonospora endophytica]